MIERRPHWDDDLINAVRTAMRPRILTCADTIDTYDVIAAVEDWVLSPPIFDLYLSRKHAPDKAAIQRVRKLCDDFEHDENLNGGIGRYAVVRVDRVRSALNGERDD